MDPVTLAWIPGSQALSPGYFVSRSSTFGRFATTRRALHFLRTALASLPRQREKTPRLEQDAVLLVSFTENQRVTLAPIAGALEEKGVKVQVLDPRAAIGPITIRYAARLASLPFLPSLLSQLARARGYSRKSFKWAFDLYWLGYGLYVVSRRWLASGRPAMLVVANDHTLWPRTLVAAARATGIPTAYVQHAAVEPGFPPLEYDFAFLEGRQALRVYEGAGASTTAIFLAGIAKLDDASLRVAAVSGSGVALCVNAFDPPERIADVAQLIRTRFPKLRCVVRPHPAMKQEWVGEINAIARGAGFEWSDPGTEKIGSLLATVERLISGGASSVLLEAAAAGVDPIAFDFSGNNHDMYGFASGGLAICCRTHEELVAALARPSRSPEELLRRAREYSETAGTPLAGRTGELIAEVVAAHLSGGAQPGPNWTSIADSSLRAFRPSAQRVLSARAEHSG